ncbi:hypothetical protein E4U17_007970 [Claviceps sp. LM77 group G4]|nr:hypothetical protein E4U17_007970 [Claviceps sp. LM77 group G4]KAG6084673.1 hypothetical protein E4U33_002987 [Claviceps sp. LM78 group G4]KAG6084701.1 hypothetical protein E4U33_003017 [Claviceps sp. LM78 group G4]
MFKPPMRIWAMVNHIVVWISAIIVTGVISWMIKVHNRNSWSENRTKILYEEIIAIITFLVWTVVIILPLVGHYRGHLWPADLIFSFLWFAAFIFSAQDWAGDRCSTVGPVEGHCGRKRAVMAFSFLAFFCLMVNVFVEELTSRTREDTTDHPVSKNRSARATGDAEAGNRGDRDPQVV